MSWTILLKCAEILWLVMSLISVNKTAPANISNGSNNWAVNGPIRWQKFEPSEDWKPVRIVWRDPEKLSHAFMRRLRRLKWQVVLRWQHRSLNPSILEVLKVYFRASTTSASYCMKCTVELHALLFHTRVWDVYGIRESLESNSTPDCAMCRLRATAIVKLLESEKAPKNMMVRVRWNNFDLIVFDGNSSSRTTIELYTTSDSTAETKFNRLAKGLQHISLNSQDDCDLDRILSMVTTCDRWHTMCKETDIPVLPARVLDLSNPKQPVLIETVKERARYTTLSYCWGKDVIFIKTTQQTLESWKNGINWELLPRTFQEAIRITVKIGIRYIWIDSLCILQDSTKDWQIQSGKMSGIYADSYLTIAASCSTNPHDGFLRMRLPKKRVSCIDADNRQREVFARVPSNHLITTLSATSDDMTDLLLTRGWGFQERRLARRVLHFTHIEAIFTCVSSTNCECGGFGRTSHHFQKRKEELFNPDLANVLMEWDTEIMSFSKLDLTFFKDRLPALSGMAQHYTRHGLGKYLGGVWESSLPGSLFWSYGNTGTNDISPGQYIAPSWSWSSFPGSIYIDRAERTWTYPVSEDTTNSPLDNMQWSNLPCVLDAVCVPTGIDPFGAISSGRIRIRGRLKHLTAGELWKMQTHNSPRPEFDPRVQDSIEDDEEYALALLGIQGQMSDTVPVMLCERIAPMVAYRALLLRPSHTELGAFERIGIVPWQAAHATSDLVNILGNIKISEVVVV